jgi:hypothetical protein
MIDNVVKKPKTAIVIPRSLRRGISSIRYYDTFRFTKRSLAALGMTILIFLRRHHDLENRNPLKVGYPLHSRSVLKNPYFSEAYTKIGT